MKFAILQTALAVALLWPLSCEFARGFFWRQPRPNFKLGRQWSRGKDVSCALIFCSVPVAIFVAGFLFALALLWPLSVHAADRLDKPSLAFCLAAKAAVVAAGSERAAEDAARAQGVSEATIAKAKRCKAVNCSHCDRREK